MPFTTYVLETFVAPGLGEFAHADIPDLRPDFAQAEHWHANYFLNSLLRGSYADGLRQLALGFIRRARHGFISYHTARDWTLKYLTQTANGEQPLRLYWSAIHEWEVFVLEMQMANTLYRKVTGEAQVFEKGDGSPAQRLYDAANDVKHPGDKLMEGALPLWALGDGLHTVGGIVVAYDEAAGILRQVARVADRLQDPRSFLGDGSS